MVKSLRRLFTDYGSPLTRMDIWGVTLGCVSICIHVAVTQISRLPIWAQFAAISMVMASGIGAVTLLVMAVLRQHPEPESEAIGSTASRRMLRSFARACRGGLLVYLVGLVGYWVFMIVVTFRLEAGIRSLYN